MRKADKEYIDSLTDQEVVAAILDRDEYVPNCLFMNSFSNNLIATIDRWACIILVPYPFSSRVN